MSAARKFSPETSMAEGLVLSTNDFLFFAKKIYDLTGINLPDNEKNRALVRNRLSKLMRKWEQNSYVGLIQRIQKAGAKELEIFVSALTTNKTDFFREKTHFDFLSKALKNHFTKEKDLLIWCAAASTGQEPYTLAMVCAEVLTPTEFSRTKILATDIDIEALQKGVDAIYTEGEIIGIPPHLRSKYLNEFNGKYQISETLIEKISFCPFNLIKGPYGFGSSFHFVFCRNVLIYFDEATINKVVDGLLSVVNPMGYLFLGQSESGVMKSPNAKSMTGAVFQRTS